MTREIQPEDSVFALEKEFGTVAFFLQQFNRREFPSLGDFFHRSSPARIRIPRWFLDFDLDLDPVTFLPSRVVLFHRGRVLADYRYEVLKIQE